MFDGFGAAFNLEFLLFAPPRARLQKENCGGGFASQGFFEDDVGDLCDAVALPPFYSLCKICTLFLAFVERSLRDTKGTGDLFLRKSAGGEAFHFLQVDLDSWTRFGF